jgi:hypothetical protein
VYVARDPSAAGGTVAGRHEPSCAKPLFVELTAEAGWDGATYQRWMAEMLTANLL